jgi:hypothetical protein
LSAYVIKVSNVVSAAYSINLPPPGLAMGPNWPTSMMVAQGSTSGNTVQVSVAGTNGFSGVVNLTCSVTTAMTVVNNMPTCSLNPASVTLSGAAPKNLTLTANTVASSSAENRTKILFWFSPGGTVLAVALFFGGFRRRARWAILGLFALFVCAGMSACGGGSGNGSANSGTTLGAYTITVTGASTGITSTIGTVALTVQ